MCNNTAKIIGNKKFPNTSNVNHSVKEFKPQKRQWSKWLSNTISIGLANANEKSQLNKSYWNTYHCANVITFDDNGKGVSSYCKNRWCYTCSRIRTAKLIQGYLSELQAFENAYFVTLTRQTCTASELPKRLEEMQKTFRKINDANRKTYKELKGTSSEYKGLRKLECTLRPNDKYHPHFHLIVNTEDQAQRIVNQWLKYNKDADAKAQDIRKADEKSHKELFKYFTKLNAGKRKDGQALNLDYKRLDIIFTAMKGRVVFQAFGMLKMVQEDFTEEDLNATTNLGSEYANRLFSWYETDWIDKTTGEMLIGKEIPNKVKALIPQSKEEKEAIETFDYLKPITETANVFDAFDLEEKPLNYYDRQAQQEKEKIQNILNLYQVQAKPKKQIKQTAKQLELAITNGK